MTCTNLSFKQARMLTQFSKRKVVDPISWFVFFLLSIVFSVWYLLFEKTIPGITNVEIVKIVMMSSLSFTFFMMVPVYVNLNILKEYILDRYKNEAKKPMRIFIYLPYVVGVLLNALFFAWLLKRYSHHSISFLPSQMPLLLNALIIFGVQLISTGLIFKREFIAQNKLLFRTVSRLAKFKSALMKEEKIDSRGITSTKEMVCIKNKTGTNRVDFPAKQLLFIEAFENGSILYFKDSDGIHDVKCSDNLTNILENGLLPENLAIVKEVEKKHRLGFKMDIVRSIEIPIGKKFSKQIDLEKFAILSQRYRD